jgi:hypothetical protein
MTGGSGDLKLKLLLALRELVASDPVCGCVASHEESTLWWNPTFHLNCRKYGNDFTRSKTIWPGSTLFRGRTKRQSPRTKLKGWRENFSIYLPSSAIRGRFGLLVGKIGV